MSQPICITADKNLQRVRDAQRLVWGAFPEFAYHNDIVDAYWPELYGPFAAYQFVLVDPDRDNLLALGNCFPLRWELPLDELPEGGLEWALQTAVEQERADVTPNMLCAFQIVVAREVLGTGISYRAVQAMVDIARERGLPTLIAPVRPNRKAEHPLVSMDEYIGWKRDDGLPYDDWLRAHVRLGGRLIRVCHKSYHVRGSLADWERWTGMTFAESGAQIVPGALAPVEIDIGVNRGIYTEANVWMAHNAAANP